VSSRALGRRIPTLLAPALALALLVSGCGSSSGAKASSAPTPTAAPTPTPTLPSSPGAGKAFYVSIGDSYAAGYEPTGLHTGHTTRNGFAYLVADQARIGGKGLTLVNFACAGATTMSVLHQLGCGSGRLGPGAVNYPKQTQAQAAVEFVKKHRAEIGLITVIISGNDVTKCAKVKAAEVAPCISKALVGVKTNVASLLREIRAAAGDHTPIIGLTYPDVILGAYVSPKISLKALAPLSVAAFRGLLNPALKAQYDAINAKFIDVTAATGAYIPFTQTTTLAPYGTIPVSVAKVCQLTYYCQYQNIHPKDSGYAAIAKLIEQALPTG
jgi:lysophospholipase L1-like esterase